MVSLDLFKLMNYMGVSSYARDPIGENSACLFFCKALRVASEREPGSRREVFPSDGTAWEDDKNLTHKFAIKTIK